MQILYLPEVWHGVSDESGATIADFGGARISAELALKKRRIQDSIVEGIIMRRTLNERLHFLIYAYLGTDDRESWRITPSQHKL